MSTTARRDTAKIYQFPQIVRGTGPVPYRLEKHASTEHGLFPAQVDCGSGWYHEAAVQEAERNRKS